MSRTGWLFLPVLGAPLLHGPVLALDLLPGLKHPIDGGRAFRGHRLLGDNKTWRGALAMSAGTVGASVVLGRTRWYRERVDAPALRLGAILGFSVVAGELPNSFFKRQLGIAPGARHNPLLSLIDQADFVLTAWPLLRLAPREAAEAFTIVAAVHLPINLAGKLVGARDSVV